MIKDIFRSLVAVMFLFLALVVVAYSSNQKELLKKERICA